VTNRRFHPLLLAPALASAATAAGAQSVPASPLPAPPPAGQDLSQLSIEELAQLPVRSASKQEEPLSAAPTALYVITGDDIAHSAAATLPEVLRLAPNLNVQQVNAREYAISARGFNGFETSNKLLVLVDGRGVYSTLHSGVFWELHQPLLDDIAQIEVISGPGGTLYGPNAVNGVVSIATRDARDTLGGLVRGSYGSDERTIGARYGFALGSDAALRLYGDYYGRDGLPDGVGPNLDDSVTGYQLGFRSDVGIGGSNATLSGDLFRNELDYLPGDHERGGNLTAHWAGDLDARSSLSFQAYYDYFERRFQGASDSLETVDLEGQYNLTSGPHTLVAGAGVRTTRDTFSNNANFFQLVPSSRRLWILNGFIQDRFALTGALSLIAGVKIERSSFSGFEILPNLRLAWQPNARSLLWAAVSRAERTPSRIDRDLSAAGVLIPADQFRSERLVAFEAGYRGQPSANTSFSLSLFYNRYDRIRTAAFIGNPLPAQLQNNLKGYTYGLEAWGNWQTLPWWRLSAGLSLLGKRFHLAAGTSDITGAAALGDDPGYQLLLRSTMNLRPNLAFDAGFRAVGGLKTPDIPAYVEADARLGWRITDQVELFAAGNNLLHRTHAESNDVNRGQLAERSFNAGARLRF
jgi:iron complex outermembrane recepter protein